MKKRWSYPLILLSSFISFGATHHETNKMDHYDVPGILLVYKMSNSYSSKISFGVHVEIAPSIGIRFDVVNEIGEQVLQHNLVLWQFDNKKNYLIYNYLEHRTITVDFGAPEAGPSKYTQVGTDKIGSYTCAHLQLTGATDDSHNYWLSTQVPGYNIWKSKVINLGHFIPGMVFGGAMFDWGGLVKMTATNKMRNGQTVTETIQLVEANPNMSFPKSDFEVPAK